ncbi:MAG: hypothetical protein AAGJ87_02320, partial [Pseudomonadota bacterium]
GAATPSGGASPRWEVMRTDRTVFEEYLDARRNRPEAFFYYRPDYVDVCAVQIPVREQAPETSEDEDA